jgi:hypothetical protein
MATIDRNQATPGPWHRRLGWLVLIWLSSVLALGLVAGAMRLLMHAAGMSTH